MLDDIVNTIVSDVNTLHKEVLALQQRKKKYSIFDIFRTIIAASNGTPYCTHTNNHNLELISTGNFSYWTTKIYGIDLSESYKTYYDKYVNLSTNHNKNYYNDVNNKNDYNPLHLFEQYNILAGDGTVGKCSIKNAEGIDISSIVISTIVDISNNLVYSYNVDYDCNEHKAIFKHPLKKSDIIILDRLYSNGVTLKKLDKMTNFVVRVKKNFVYVKKFIKSGKAEDVVSVNGVSIKLIRYKIDKTTKKIIIKKYCETDDLIDEDNDDVYILATNLLTLTADDYVYLYRRRWTIEVVFKYIKSNFNIRHIVKETNINDIETKINFWINLSFCLYNQSALLKNVSDSNTGKNCRFSKIALFVRKIYSIINNPVIIKSYLKELYNIMRTIGVRFINNHKENTNYERCLKKRGKYQSFNTIKINNAIIAHIT